VSAIQRRKSNIVMAWVNTMEDMLALSNSVDEPSVSVNQKIIYLPEETIVNLIGDERENLWDVAIVSGCRVHVLSRRHSDQASNRKVILTGSPHAIELTENEIAATTQTSKPRSVLPPFVPVRDLKEQQNMN